MMRANQSCPLFSKVNMAQLSPAEMERALDFQMIQIKTVGGT